MFSRVLIWQSSGHLGLMDETLYVKSSVFCSYCLDSTNNSPKKLHMHSVLLNYTASEKKSCLTKLKSDWSSMLTVLSDVRHGRGFHHTSPSSDHFTNLLADMNSCTADKHKPFIMLNSRRSKIKYASMQLSKKALLSLRCWMKKWMHVVVGVNALLTPPVLLHGW